MHTIVSSLYHSLLNLISPPFCAYCGQFISQRTPLCTNCRKQIQPIVSTIVPITKKYPLKLFAISRYKEPLKSMVLAKSYRCHVTSRQLGELIWELTDIANISFDYIVPIPLHWRRFASRGYNQTAEMAQVIAQKSNTPLIHALKRINNRPFQSHVTPEKRHENVCGAFKLREHCKEQLAGKHVLIVDDLFTTGATMKSAAREIVRARPDQITAVVACRTG